MAQHDKEGMQLIWRAGLAGVAAVVVTLALWLVTELVFGGAAIIGAILGLVTFIFTGMAGGEPVVRYGDNASKPPAPTVPKAAPTVPASGEAPKSAPKAAPSASASASAPAASETVGASDVVKPSTPLAGEAELAARKGDWKYEGNGAAAADGGGAAAETPAVSAEAVAEATEAEPGTLYTDAAPADPDDLKQIKGVGPGLEKTLNELGIYKFSQIMTWGASEIAWVDARLKFKGRITRDDWIGQATTLASGGETEFSKKVDKGGVY